MRPAKTQISLGILPVWSESSLSAWRKFGSSLSAQRSLWSDWMDVQADLSLRWAHSHFVIPPTNYFCGGYTVFTLSVHSSFCPSIRDVLVFSSPEPWGSQGELIVYPYSGVRCRRQQCLNIFPLKPHCQSKPNFMWSLLGKGERKFI